MLAGALRGAANLAGHVGAAAFRHGPQIAGATLSAGASVLGAGARGGVLAAHAGYGALKVLGRGRMPLTWEQSRIGRFSFALPQINRAASWTLGLGAVGVGAAQAVNDQRDNGWSISRANFMGMPEIERPSMMGATGSLTLAIANGRRRREQPGMGMTAQNYAAGMADDLVRYL